MDESAKKKGQESVANEKCAKGGFDSTVHEMRKNAENMKVGWHFCSCWT